MGLLDPIKGVFGANARNNREGRDQLNAATGAMNNAGASYNQQIADFNNLSGQLANQNYYGGAQNALQQQQQSYQQQGNAAQMLYNQATGNMPSAADMQMQQGLGNANNQVQSAMLSQQGGVAPGLSQRNMLAAQAQQNAAIVGQGMINRAQETAAGQQAYSNALANQAGTANAMYQNNYGLGNAQYQQGQNNLGYITQNANNNYQAQMANAQNQFNMGQGNLNQQTQSQQAATAALGNTISSAAGFLMPKAPGK